MTSTPHPSYENPTIQEAVCEIQFQQAEGVSWDPTWYGEFYKVIQDEFPTFQPVSFPILLEVSNRPRGSTMLAVPQAIRFHHASRNLLLQLYEARITVSVLADYPGWAHMRDDIRRAWEVVHAVTKPVRVNRLGLRYINRVERSKAKETGDRWFVPNEFVPQAILHSLPPFLVRAETRPDDVNRTNVSFTHLEVETSEHGAFFLDIDRATEAELSVDTDLLLQEVDRLHDDVWQIFQSTKGERLERLLQGEIP